MSFDEIPENKSEGYPCPECAQGSVTIDSDGCWSCDKCDFCREDTR